ncbi:MAG: hypothetical protein F6K36_06055 [Symploca sp. SIO3C6]|nr:hypothetical protein [Symploca sp. SIO3C6]NET08174.1 hypothetical protein [Symploca sp. SIO2B6]
MSTYAQELMTTSQAIVALGKGILAIDQSNSASWHALKKGHLCNWQS